MIIDLNDLGLQDFQYQFIKEKQNLNFEQSLNEKNERKTKFNKSFRNEMDIYFDYLHNNGVLFYGITINLTTLGTPQEAWEIIHLKVEQFFHTISEDIELIEFCYLSIEKHNSTKIKNKKLEKTKRVVSIVPVKNSLINPPHIHGVIGIRSILGKNSGLLSQIRAFLYECCSDIVIKDLIGLKHIKSYWNYCVKENNWKFHRMMSFSYFFHNEFARISEHERLRLNEPEEPTLISGGFYPNSKYADIKGIGNLKVSSKNVLMYLLNLYFYEKKYYVCNNEIYKRKENSKFSWNFVDKLSYLKVNSANILQELKTKYSQHLGSLDIAKVLVDDFSKIYNDILDNNHFLPNISFNNDIIEFMDGLYFLDFDYFLEYKNYKQLIPKLKINCYKYFEKTFSSCVKNLPLNWLHSIGKNITNIEDFCANLGRYFHSKKQLIDKKRKTLCIMGSSNTGKTTLVANILTEIIGVTNIGMLKDSEGFAFEQIEDKKIIICNEFKYTKSNRSKILKVMDNIPMLLDKKVFVNHAPILFVFNTGYNNKMLKDQAFINRLLIYIFTYEFTDLSKDIHKVLIQELAQIMIYCNKLYFKKIYSENCDKNKYKKKQVNEYLNKLIE